ncbi:MAG: SUF system NifU family Fe-S cluster assembly protein, partial [Spirochaetia bacterium]
MHVLGLMRGMLVDGNEPDLPEEAADLEALQGVKQFPVRIKCAMLSWNTLEQMLEDAGLAG